MPDDVRDRMIGERLGELARASRASSPCLDAETLAAWADGALSRATADSVEAHLASCAQCRTVTAMLGTSGPIESTPDRPQVIVDITSAHSKAPTPAVAARRWILPAGVGAAAAVALWFATVGRAPTPPVPSPTQPATEMARAEPGPPPTLPSAPSSGAQAFGRGQASQPAARAASDKVGPSEDRRAAPGVESVGESQITTAPPPDALPPAQGPASLAAPPAAPPLPSATVPPPLPVRPSASADAALSRSTSSSLVQSMSSLAPDPRFVVSSPDGSVQWRVRADNRLERSVVATDTLAQGRDAAVGAPGAATSTRVGAGRGGRGQTPRLQGVSEAVSAWEQLALPAGVVLTAGSSPSRDVSWFAGRSGVVFVTTPASGLRQVSAPVTLDLTAVVATSSRSAIVVSSDARRFATDDAGETWREVP